MTEFLNGDLFKYLMSLIVAVVTWLGSKKLYQKKEVEKMDADILRENLTIYQNMLDDIERRYEEMLAKRDDEIKELTNDIKMLKIKLKEYEQTIGRDN